MTDYHDHYWEFTKDISEQLEAIKAKIKQGLDQVANSFNEAPGLSSNWAWAVSPGGKAAYELARAQFQGELDAVWEKFRAVSADLWKKADQLTGDPWTLMALNRSYNEAAGKLEDEEQVITTITEKVSNDWEGDAFRTFEQVGKRQIRAVKGISGNEGLKEVAKLCAEGALEIRKAWRVIVDALIEVARFILQFIKDGLDAGQWATFDAGPTINLIGQIATAALAQWNKLDSFFDTASTVTKHRWRDLNNGVPGLDRANTWPPVSASELDDMDDKEDWKPS